MAAEPSAMERQSDAAVLGLIPQPAHLTQSAGHFVLRDDTVIWVVGEAAAPAMAVGRVLAEALGLSDLRSIGNSPPTGGAPAMVLVLDAQDQDLSEEAYRLIISPARAELRARRPAGLFRGVQTLRQLADAARARGERDLPCLGIDDAPRYRWRGMHLDVCRHFFDVDFVKRYLDLMAYHKFNVFHWHLTEDQAWRIEIRRHPRLTEIGAFRREPDGSTRGGFYTQDEIREVVRYAQERFITVVPEIEMPGHCRAALAAYPELSCTGRRQGVPATWGVFEDVYCAGNDQVFRFLEEVFEEVLELFPGPYVHLGGDECPKTRWQACDRCQARIRTEGLADEDELQSYFVKRVARFLQGRGRQVIGWDEILEGGLAADAIVMSWRGVEGGVAAARAGHPVVMCPVRHCYFNLGHPAAGRDIGHPGTALALRDVYRYEPTPAELTPAQAACVLGSQGNVWTEYIHTPAEVEWMAFPRLCAMAEVLWSPKAKRDWDDFQTRLDVHRQRLDAWQVNYYRTLPSDAAALPEEADREP